MAKQAESAVPATMNAAMVPSVQEEYSFMAMADRAIFEENLGGEPINPFDLTRVKVPSGGGLAWTIPTFDGDQEVAKVINGIIVSWRDTRSYWASEYTGEGSPPDCSCQDMKAGIGVGTPGGHCEACPYSQFGSDPKGGGGQACKLSRLLFVMTPGSVLPMVITVPPTSVKNVRQYFMGLVGKQIPFHGCISSFGLAQDKNKKGLAYSTIIPKMYAQLAPEDAAKVKAYADSVKSEISKVTADAGDFA
jgi:hypothetical protein